jgi:CheY-like chemotaxis protein
VRVESAGEGKGATFRVTLPLGAPRSARPDLSRTVTRNLEGVRVLLVEDDDDTRESYAAMLSALGVDVRAAPSAAAGLATLTEFRPQAILSDIAMPEEDGFSFIRKVRRLEPARGGAVPAAALTALASDDDRQRALKAGYQLHISKPVDAVRLATVIGTLIDWNTAH